MKVPGRYVLSMVDKAKVLTDNRKMVIPKPLRKRIVTFIANTYSTLGRHVYLEETLRATITWEGLKKSVQRHVSTVLPVKNRRNFKEVW